MSSLEEEIVLQLNKVWITSKRIQKNTKNDLSKAYTLK